MLKFARNKLVSIRRKDKDTLLIHGTLDDDIYSLEINLSLRISSLEILFIEGKWNRWTTPECPRSTPFLREIVGFHIGEEGFSQKVHKIVGRKSCRHYANLLLECCHSAKEAALLANWADAKEKYKDLGFEDFLKGALKEPQIPTRARPVLAIKHSPQKDRNMKTAVKKMGAGGMIIDLHVHSSPASPCSSAPVDDLVEEAKRIGLSGICLTDHNYVWSPESIKELRQKHGFLTLRGNEITTDQGDMLVFGFDRDIKGIIKLVDLAEEVHVSGGIIIAAHPFRGFLTFGAEQLGLTVERAMERPLFKHVDAVEVLNSKVTEKENSFASKVAEGLGLFATGGSDAHEVSEVGIYATRFSDNIENEKDLVEALKRGNFEPTVFRGDLKEAEKPLKTAWLGEIIGELNP